MSRNVPFYLFILQVKLLWVAIPCSVVVGHQYFGGPCSFHLQVKDEDGGNMKHKAHLNFGSYLQENITYIRYKAVW